MTVVSPTQITATTGGGAKPGPFHVFVTDNGATSAAGSAVFTYTLPVVSGVSPTSGSVNGGTVITITGQQFVSGASVQIAQGQGGGSVGDRGDGRDRGLADGDHRDDRRWG